VIKLLVFVYKTISFVYIQLYKNLINYYLFRNILVKLMYCCDNYFLRLNYYNAVINYYLIILFLIKSINFDSYSNYSYTILEKINNLKEN